jgi:hypothetical protein
MKMWILFGVIFLFYPMLLSAQQAVLKGRVIDAVSNEPLPFVNVVVSGAPIGAVTDVEGTFQLTGRPAGFIRI